jgi:hypothetical protein
VILALPIAGYQVITAMNQGVRISSLLMAILGLAIIIPTIEKIRKLGLYTHRVMLIGLLIFIFDGAYVFRIAGTLVAQKQEVFPIITQSPEVVVLRSYGEYLFAAPLHRQTHEFEKKFVILKMAEAEKKPLTLSIEKVGPLRVKP